MITRKKRQLKRLKKDLTKAPSGKVNQKSTLQFQKEREKYNN